jgi:hypothetical protein
VVRVQGSEKQSGSDTVEQKAVLAVLAALDAPLILFLTLFPGP